MQTAPTGTGLVTVEEQSHLRTFLNSVRTYSTIDLYIQSWELGPQPVNLDIHEETVTPTVHTQGKTTKHTKHQHSPELSCTHNMTGDHFQWTEAYHVYQRSLANDINL